MHAVGRCVGSLKENATASVTTSVSRMMVALMLSLSTVSISTGVAQGPGTLPPPGLLQDTEPWPERLEGIRPDAFLFQDESNTPVVMPRMSFEEIDRLRKLDRGGRSGDQIVTLERLWVTGTMGQSRAQWDAELAIRLDGAAVRESAGRSVVVDIGFAGAYLIQAADIRFAPGVDVQRDDAIATNNAEAGGADAERNGELVSGAYVRLTPRRDVGKFGAGSPSDTVMGKTIGAFHAGLGVPPADLSPLPPAFPAVLRQAMNADGGGVLRHDGGYQLVLPLESLVKKFASPRTAMIVKVHLPLSARVWTTPHGESWLPLSLPAVSTLIEVDLDDSDDDTDAALLDVVGSGREVARRLEGADRYAVECDGGMIALRVTGAAESAGDTGDLLEVESETQLQWESPTEPPTMDVRLVTKNLRGPLHGCEIRLPASAVLVSPPEIVAASSESRDNAGVSDGVPEAAWWEVVIARADEATESRGQDAGESTSHNASADGDGTIDSDGTIDGDATRIVVRWAGTDPTQAPSSVHLRLQIRQFPPEASATDPWVLRIPQVTDAIGHRGQVTIRTAGDHRLRWRPRMGIDAVVAAQTDSGNGDLVYPFRFTQTRFELPIWLSRKQQQIRLSADAELAVTRRAARVEIDLRAGGVGIDPKGLRLDLGSWRLIGIKTELADSELDIATTDGSVEWQVDTSDGKWPTSYQITAERLATATTDEFESLTLPRLVSTDSASVLRDVRLSLADDRRETWLVDLAGSPALQRIPGQNESTFRFLIPESPWSLSGSFATRPLELQWRGEVFATQSSDHWVIRSQWTITSALDLEGRLKVAVPIMGNGDPGARTTTGSPSSSTPNLIADTGTARSTDRDADAVEPTSGVTPAGDPAASAGSSDGTGTPRRWTAMVDGNPASVRGPLVEFTSGSEFAEREVYEIVSPHLAAGTQRVELVLEQPILPTKVPGGPRLNGSPRVGRGEINGLFAVPSPVADQVELMSPLQIQMPLGVVDSAGVFWRVVPDMDESLGDYTAAGGFQRSAPADDAIDATAMSEWTFKIIPDFPIPIVLRSRLGEEKLTEIPRAFLRSLVGRQFRHEHLMATVRGGRRVRLGLPASLQTIRVEVLLDGRPTARTRDASGLRIDLPDSSRAAHLLDVRIWVEEPSNPWWSRTEPMIRLPVGSGLQYWQLLVPTDSHLFWASNQSGRAMRWHRDGLNLSRVPTASDSNLIRWALDLDWQVGDSPAMAPDASHSSPISGSANSVSGQHDTGIGGSGGVPDAVLQAAIRESLSNATFAVPGNRYLFFAGNTFSFAAVTLSRTVLWLAVGGLVLLLAAAVQWFPALHHSLMAFVLAIALAGLLVIAPDGIVLTAQLVVISLTLVAVFYAISAVTSPRGGQRVLPPRSSHRDSVIGRSSSDKRERERIASAPSVATKPATTSGAPAEPPSLDSADQQETQEFDVGNAPAQQVGDASLVPGTHRAAEVFDGTHRDESSDRESAASSGLDHASDSHSGSSGATR